MVVTCSTVSLQIKQAAGGHLGVTVGDLEPHEGIGVRVLDLDLKDACSQAPGFIRGLEVFAPPEMHLIYTFPNFESCAKVRSEEIGEHTPRARRRAPRSHAPHAV